MHPALAMTIVILGVGAFATLVYVALRRAAAKRRAALDAVAQNAGWSFSGDVVDPDALGLGSFPLLLQGRGRKARNVMRVSASSPAVTAFEYEFTTGGGEHRHTAIQTVVHVTSPRYALPTFMLGPENFFHKIGGLFGYHDIDFEANPEFSKKYLLRSKEAEPQVRDLFTPSVRAYFEQRMPLTLEAQGDGMLIYRAGRRVKPEDMQTFVEDALAAARQFER